MAQDLSVPISLAVVSALIGFLVWIAQRIIERRADERRRKEELYGTLLAATLEFSSYGNGAPFIIESQRAWLYASDEVLSAINKYLSAFLKYLEQRDGQDSKELSANWDSVQVAEGVLRLAIRKELHPATRVDEKWVKDEWTIITSHKENIREYLTRAK